MSEKVDRAVAIVGVGAVLPDAPDAHSFWDNVTGARYSISDVPVGRWDPDLYHDPDPTVPDATYSKIGGWVTEWDWDPMAWRLPIPPKVSDAMDRAQIWSIVAAREALVDYGYPDAPLDGDRTAVVLGNAMGGDKHYETALRIYAPEYVRHLESSPSFFALDPATRAAIVAEFRGRVADLIPDITEDTMPGELANITAGRIANLFDFHGPNFVTDAACASALAGMDAAIEGLENGDYDAVLAGGVDANMSASTFVKFCKIGALSATGTRPYGSGADGFVMGEGAAVFLLKRLEDAERDGDRIYAVVRGLAGSSDGRGKGITAPNPVGQKLAVRRAWENAGSRPDTATLIEGHGTSTRVGDVVEVESISEVFSSLGLPTGSIPLGSVKSNIGHLKAAAGAAGLLKAALALDRKVLPPSLNADTPNPNIDFGASPLFVNTELQEWKASPGQVRQAGVSAFGFGGTNFHVVLEEYVPGRIRTNDRRVTYSLVGGDTDRTKRTEAKAPLRGALVVGDETLEAIAGRLRDVAERARAGTTPPIAAPRRADLAAPHRVAIDWGDADELASKIVRVLAAIESDNDAAWQMLANQGVFRGSGSAGHVAFLYTGQGSQYVNMLEALRAHEPVVAETFAEADVVMEPILGKPLTDYIFIDTDDPEAVAASEIDLMQTEITQPAVLTVDRALMALLGEYGVEPDMVMGHSLGEYGALVAAGALPFADALRAVAGRGREMANVQVDDRGLMAAVFAPLEEIESVVEATDGYVVVANVNSRHQAVIGGSTAAVRSAMEQLESAGHQVIQLPVSHAFHTEIVAPASEPLKEMLARLDLRSPAIPLVANVSGAFYPKGPQVEREMIEILGEQISSPVQFVAGLETLYDAGARVFVEVGPKRALQGLADDVLGDRDVRSLFTNHPKQGDIVSFNQALCGLYAEGLGTAIDDTTEARAADGPPAVETRTSTTPTEAPPMTHTPRTVSAAPGTAATTHDELGRLLADFLDRAYDVYRGPADPDAGRPAVERPVVVTGAGLGLPGMDRVFDPRAISRLLHGEQFIDSIPVKRRQEIVDHHITRLVKSESGGGHFETIDTQADVIKLAGRGGSVDLAEEFGFPEERATALDRTSELAIGAGIDALADAGIPLVLRYKTATTGALIPERWMLPDALRDDTGVIFASAFPGADSLVDEVSRFHEDKAKHDRLDELRQLRRRADGVLAEDLDRRIHELERDLAEHAYTFDRRFLYKALSFAHAQFAEYIGARGPNTQINSACASTTQAVSLAEDWIRSGRCSRVVILSADDVTTDTLLGWVGSGFLAVGAAATDEIVEEAALPFDRRRHGMILGMGAAALVVESAESAADRGLQPIAEVLSAVTANSAFHGSRLDPSHIREVMEQLVSDAERRWGLSRSEIAPETVFVSHETYTPARGGSAQAEVDALRYVFDGNADDIVVTNTKGYTGHAMGTGVEDVLAIKALETGIVPPVPNYQEVDPDLGRLNLSQGGTYPVRYGLRLGAGFGSQVAMTLYRSVPSPFGRHPDVDQLGFDYRVTDPAQWAAWLADVTGYDDPAVEVTTRTLRVADRGAPQRAPAARRELSGLRSRVSTAGVDAPVAASSVVRSPSSVPAPAAPEPEARSSQLEAGSSQLEAPSDDPVADRVLAIVAVETGYPPEMLDLDLDLEADLGIDTVKQAEMFAAIRREWGIERDDDLALRDYPTLRAVIGFVYERADGLSASSVVRSPSSVPAPAAPEPEARSSQLEAQSDDPVATKVLEIVAVETGYPPEMLDLDLDLEADLGIDTVKQAEMFAAIRSEWGIERDDDLALRDYPTLRAVIGFVREKRPDLAPAAPVAGLESRVSRSEAGGPSGGLETQDSGLETSYALERRVPVPLARPGLELCATTGVELGEGSKVIVALDGGGVGSALVDRLMKRGVDVLTVDDAPDADELRSRIDAWKSDGSVTGVYWLPALDVEAAIEDMDLATWREGLRVRVKLLYETMRHCYEDVAGAGTFLVSATRMGGRFGFDESGPSAPMGGAVAGFTKTYKREHPDALVKVVDLAPSRRTAALADLLIDETLADPGPVEVGRTDDGMRWTLGLAIEDLPGEPTGMRLGPDSVFVVTGAAGSIVSAITADLAEASGGVFHLLDLVPSPDRDSPDLALYRSDPDALRMQIFEALKETGERATPAAVEREIAGFERASAALDAIEAIERCGGTAHYHSVDLLDEEAMATVMGSIAELHERVDVVVHAGGLEISRLLPDKRRSEYDLVFDVKADGWFNLLAGLVDTEIGATVAFSSIAGRFGNAGQSDYSAANDLLCKHSLSLRSTRPGTTGIAIDWTAWGDIGMATRGSIPTIMKAAGIDMLPAAIGVPFVRDELTGASGSREVLVAQRLGMLLDEWDDAGGLDPATLAERVEGAVMIDTVESFGVHTGLTTSVTLDPTEQGFLFDHRIDGTPVLPGVMGIEAFAEVAALPWNGLVVAAAEDVEFLAPFKFYKDEPRTVTVHARFLPDDGGLVAECRLTGSRTLPTSPDPVVTTHFVGRVRLRPERPELATRSVPDDVEGVGSDDLYAIYFHGPTYRVVDHAWRSGEVVAGSLAAGLPANHVPDTASTITSPRLLELCFQTAGAHEIGTTGTMALPMRIGRVVYGAAPPVDGQPATAVVAPAHRGYDAWVVGASGPVLDVEGYCTVPLPGGVEETLVEPLREVMRTDG